MGIKKGVILIILIICVVHVVSAEYYADVKIEVYDNGLVEIKGDSNHPLLQEGIYDNLTSKDNGYWILNISTNEIFLEYSYELSLPKNVNINYLGVRQIDSFVDEGNLHISGSVTDKPFAIIIQYKQGLFESSFLWLYGLLLMFLIGIFIYLFIKKRKHIQRYSKNEFSEREFLIIQLLQKNNGSMTQSGLEKKTNLPKASLHRNISSLERKNVIGKNQAGMTNKITLKA